MIDITLTEAFMYTVVAGFGFKIGSEIASIIGIALDVTIFAPLFKQKP